MLCHCIKFSCPGNLAPRICTPISEESNYTVTAVTVQYLECETPFHPKAFKIPVL